METVISALFDFDGVVVDTEPQYSRFWHKIGTEHLGMDNFDALIKGQTLTSIYNRYFSGQEDLQSRITAALLDFERNMDYVYVPGVREFVADLRLHGVRTAVVTSSNVDKMETVYRHRPEIRGMFDRIFVSEDFSRSKPDPDCYLLGMRTFGATPDSTYVFEDSFNGLQAGMASGATVIGLSTTNAADAIAPLCHHVIADFTDMDYGRLMQISKQ